MRIEFSNKYKFFGLRIPMVCIKGCKSHTYTSYEAIKHPNRRRVLCEKIERDLISGIRYYNRVGVELLTVKDIIRTIEIEKTVRREYGQRRTKSPYHGEDMVGDDGYGTWTVERLDEEYRKLKRQNKELIAEIEELKSKGSE